MKKAILLLLTIGWILPLWGHFFVMNSWFSSEVIPKLNGNPQLNSFPQYEFAQQLLVMAGIWAAYVLVGWATYLIFKGGSSVGS